MYLWHNAWILCVDIIHHRGLHKICFQQTLQFWMNGFVKKFFWLDFEFPKIVKIANYDNPLYFLFFKGKGGRGEKVI